MKFASIIPNYEQTMEKLLTMCCRLSREAWIVHTVSAKGITTFTSICSNRYKSLVSVFFFFLRNSEISIWKIECIILCYVVGNSKQRWENMLSEITNMEYMVVKCQSIIRKLYPNAEKFETDVSFFFGSLNWNRYLM